MVEWIGLSKRSMHPKRRSSLPMKLSNPRAKGVRLSVIITMIALFSVFATFIVNTAVSYRTQTSALLGNSLEMNAITAQELSRTTQTMVESMREAIRKAAETLQTTDPDSAEAASLLDFFLNATPYFNSTVIVDPNGIVQATSPSTLNLIGQQLTSEPATESLKSRKPLMSEPYLAVTQRLIVMVSHPIFGRSGEYRGFIAGTIYLQETNVFQKILSSPFHENGSYYYVVDSKGRLLYHPDMDRLGELVSANPAVRELMAGRSGQTTLVNTKGVPVVAGYAVVPGAGLGIVSQTPQSALLSSADRLVWRMAATALPLVALLLALVIWFSLRLSAPLGKLARIAAQYNQGEYLPVPLREARHWNYETNELYRTIMESFKIMDGRTQDLSAQAHTDPLTGLANRRYMDAVVAEWFASEKPFAVLMMDLDHFKSVNDTYGHQKGDEVLVFLADVIREQKRESDLGCRYGGEEFTLLLPHADRDQARHVAERIRMRVEAGPHPIDKPVTLSLGISSYPRDARHPDQLFRQADDALYAAKQGGRNRTVVHGMPE